MKRWISLLLLMGLSAATLAPPAAAQGATTRMDTARYKGPSYTPYRYHVCARDATMTCVRFMTKKHEKYVSLDIRDSTGQVLEAEFVQPGTDFEGEFCGQTHAPVRIAGGVPLHVYVYGRSESCDPNTATATVGIVEATFSTGGDGR